MTSLTTALGRGDRDWDGLQFRAIFAICLPACLFAAASRRLTPAFWRAALGGRQGLLTEAWEAAGTTARFALAG